MNEETALSIATEQTLPYPLFTRCILRRLPRDSKPFPNDLGGVRNKIADVVSDINDIKEILQRPSVWSWAYWEDHKAKLTIILFAVGLCLSGAGYVFNLTVDSHIRLAISPVQQQLQTLDGKVENLAGIVGVLQAQIAAQKYLSVPPKDLKTHNKELKELKENLAHLPTTAPGYWPTTFQVISLLSQAMWQGCKPLALDR